MKAPALLGRAVLSALSMAVVLAWCEAGTGFADASCDPVYGHLATPADLSGISCQKVLDETMTSGHGPVHVSIWARTPSTPASLGPVTARVASVVRASIQAYDPFAPVSWDIAIAIGNGIGPWHATQADRDAAGMTLDAAKFTTTRFHAGTERCVIDLNLLNTRLNLSESDYKHFLDWVVAHEMFHCVQAFNFTEQFFGTGDHAWWLEGQAEYFPALVVPASIPSSTGEWKTFGALSRSESLFEMGRPDDPGYANAMLFMYLDGPRLGSADLYRLFRDLPDAGDPAQASYLAGHYFDTMFDDFAMAFADGALRTRIPSLSVMPVDPHFAGAIDIHGDSQAFFSPDAAGLIPSSLVSATAVPGSVGHDIMHVYRGRMTLYPSHAYSIAATGGAHIDIEPEGFGWIRAPDGNGEIDVCDDPLTVTAVATEVNPSAPFLPELVTKVIEGAHPVCGERDQCLVGRWQPDPRHIERITEALGARANAQATNGPLEMSFFADGRWQLAFRNLAISWLSSAGMRGRVVFANMAQGRWAASPSTGLRSSVMSDHTYASAFLNGRHVTTLSKIASSFGMVQNVDPGLPYTCVGDTLTFSQPSTAGGLVYHRLSRDPVRHQP